MKLPDRFSIKEFIFTAVAFVLISLIAKFAQAETLKTPAHFDLPSIFLTK